MLKRSLVLVGVLLTLGVFLRAQTPGVTVQATVVDGSGTPLKTASMNFQLWNCGANVPQVLGTAGGGNTVALIQQQFVLYANPSNGLISGTIYGNDQIICGGTQSTMWLVTEYKYTNVAAGPPQYYCLVSGTSFNPAGAQPCQVTPPSPGFLDAILKDPIVSQIWTQPAGTVGKFVGTFDATDATFIGLSGGGGGGGGNGCGAGICLLAPPVAGIVTADGIDGTTGVAGTADINAALNYTAANDAAVVHTTGTETINGLKTFGSDTTFSGNVFIYGSFNLMASGPLLLQGIKQTGIPPIGVCGAQNCDYGLYVNSSGILTCQLFAGGSCIGSGPPSGTAGGDLAGTYPNPTVAQINGEAFPASAGVVGSNSSSQPIAATAEGVSAPLVCNAASGSGTTYTCTTSPVTTLVANKTLLLFTADVANTGAATLNVDSIGAASITKQGGGTLLVANDFLAGQRSLLLWDGTHWQMQGQLGNAPAGSGTVNGSSYAGCPAYYAGTGTVVGCPNGTLNIAAMGNASSAPQLFLYTLASSGTTEYYTPMGTENLVISAQKPANDVFDVAVCVSTNCTPSRQFFVDSSGITHVSAALQMGSGAIIQGLSDNVATIYSSGSDTNAVQASATYRAGNVTGVGNFAAGISVFQPGALTNASPGASASEGTMVFNAGVFRASGTPTPGNLACIVSSSTVGNCASSSTNAQFVGIVQSVVGGSVYVQTAGTVTVNLDTTYTYAANDFVCVSTTTAGLAKMATTGVTPCSGYNTHVGFATASGAAVNTVSVFLSR